MKTKLLVPSISMAAPSMLTAMVAVQASAAVKMLGRTPCQPACRLNERTGYCGYRTPFRRAGWHRTRPYIGRTGWHGARPYISELLHTVLWVHHIEHPINKIFSIFANRNLSNDIQWHVSQDREVERADFIGSDYPSASSFMLFRT